MSDRRRGEPGWFALVLICLGTAVVALPLMWVLLMVLMAWGLTAVD